MTTEQAKLHPIRHGMYVLPSLFTAGNIAMGFYAILQSIRGLVMSSPAAFDHAAIAIILAGVFDGLDGRIARLTNTSSAFGRELDSLADVITFGRRAKPACLSMGSAAGGAERLSDNRMARAALRSSDLLPVFHLWSVPPRSIQYQHRPEAAQPRPAGPKIFRRYADPRRRGRHCSSRALRRRIAVHDLWLSVVWIALVAFTGFLMVSSWRFWSGKEIDFSLASSAADCWCC